MTRKLWAALSHFWTSDHGLTIFLGLLVAVAFVLPPIVPLGVLGKALSDAFFSLLLIAGAYTIAGRGVRLWAISGIGIAAMVVRWIYWFVPSPAFLILREWASLMTLVLFTLVVLAHTFRGGSVRYQRVKGAVAAYLLLGLSWAGAYELIALGHPGAFGGAIAAGGEGRELIYYSFVTLTTVGYGDITPVHPVARSLAIMESLTGQLYIAVVLARLVSLELLEKRNH
jgi:hypothetical protein